MRIRLLSALAAILLGSCSKKSPMPPPTELGTFEVESGKLFVVDPGYPPEKPGVSELAEVIPHARKGTWSFAVVYVNAGQAGVRCAELRARHASLPSTQGLKWRRQQGLVGVDSGQAGVFDAGYYHEKQIVPKNKVWKEKPLDPDDLWYSLCCEVTLGNAQAGVIPFGGVSSSGFGDGAYEWDSVEAGGEVVAVRVIFLKDGDF